MQVTDGWPGLSAFSGRGPEAHGLWLATGCPGARGLHGCLRMHSRGYPRSPHNAWYTEGTLYMYELEDESETHG